MGNVPGIIINEQNCRFIDTAINVFYNEPPLLEKKPCCPDAFVWDDQRLEIREMVMEWVDYTRRGRMARNMSDAHAKAAAGKGSWGVGRFYFRVMTDNGRCFDIYYDRAPKGLDERKGRWVLFREFLDDREKTA
jgi:hypothetical protein